MAKDRHTVAVLAPLFNLTITIESIGEDERDDIHIHPGGQGFWVARMLRHLNERPVLCAPVGGESGRVLRGLAGEWGIDLSPVHIESRSPSYLHDRRSGERRLLAEEAPPVLGRHEIDDLYGKFLDHAIGAGVCVITGQVGEIFPVDMYRRLGKDLETAEVVVVGDLHGDALHAFLDGGKIDVLKVSDEDLREDGELEAEEELQAWDAVSRLQDMGARDVILSRGPEPAMATFGGKRYRVSVPALEPVDHRGAGDSMTAGLTASRIRSLPAEESLRLAAAAGAANVTRHGLGSGSDDLITQLAGRVEIELLAKAPS